MDFGLSHTLLDLFTTFSYAGIVLAMAIDPTNPGRGRIPPFGRFDARLEKRWSVGQRGWVSFVVEALNATLSREVTGYACASVLVLPGLPDREPRLTHN